METKQDSSIVAEFNARIQSINWEPHRKTSAWLDALLDGAPTYAKETLLFFYKDVRAGHDIPRAINPIAHHVVREMTLLGAFDDADHARTEALKYATTLVVNDFATHPECYKTDLDLDGLTLDEDALSDVTWRDDEEQLIGCLPSPLKERINAGIYAQLSETPVRHLGLTALERLVVNLFVSYHFITDALDEVLGEHLAQTIKAFSDAKIGITMEEA